MRKKQGNDTKLRNLIAYETAKIIAQEGVKDFWLAKNKAVSRLGQSTPNNLPSNSEIKNALLEYHRLFKVIANPTELRKVREKIVTIMALFKNFNPRLVEPVVTALYKPLQEAHFHLYAYTVEEVMFLLMDQDIPFDNLERRYRFQDNTYEYHPVLLFFVDSIEFYITVFLKRQIHDVPCNQIDNKPMQRITLQELKKNLQEEHQ